MNTNIMELSLSNFGINFEEQILCVLSLLTVICVGGTQLFAMPYIGTGCRLCNYSLLYHKYRN
jgi:hypothetical protein